MTNYTAETLDFSRLDAPTLVPIDYEDRLSTLIGKFVEFWNAFRLLDPTLPAFDTTSIESDPAVILSQVYAFGDMLLRQEINDAANSLRLPFAVGADLDLLAGTFHRTQRRILVPANSVTGAPAIYESNEEYRARAQLAPEALADMGLTPGGYVFKVRTQFADRISHVFPINRGAGRVELRVLGREGDGEVSPALLAEIIAAFQIEEGSQSTDVLTVLPAEIERITPSVTLFVPRGPDRARVEEAAATGISALGASLRRINAPVFREAIAAAAHVGPVVTVRVNSPSLDVAPRPEVVPIFGAPIVDSQVL